MKKDNKLPRPCLTCGKVNKNKESNFCSESCQLDWLITKTVWPSWQTKVGEA